MTTMRSEETITLFRPVGPAELELIRQSGFRAFPPRLPELPIFYPVLTEDLPAFNGAIVGEIEVVATFVRPAGE
jgi:hypothetical protein